MAWLIGLTLMIWSMRVAEIAQGKDSEAQTFRQLMGRYRQVWADEG